MTNGLLWQLKDAAMADMFVDNQSPCENGSRSNLYLLHAIILLVTWAKNLAFWGAKIICLDDDDIGKSNQQVFKGHSIDMTLMLVSLTQCYSLNQEFGLKYTVIIITKNLLIFFGICIVFTIREMKKEKKEENAIIIKYMCMGFYIWRDVE